MKKRIFALLLAAMLPLGAAIADEPLTDGTVLVDWVDGQEAYTAICSGELTLRYDADTNTYATADGLIWKTEGALLDYHIKCNTAPKKERHCVRFVLE